MAQKFLNGIDMTGTTLVNLPDAVAAQSPATKAQLDTAVQGYKWKEGVRAASTANLTLSGLQTVDGVSLVANDRFLAKDQTAGATNGIYLVSSGAWTRATDFDASSETLLATVRVSEGTLNNNAGWTMTTDGPITLGTTVLVWQNTSGGTTYTAGNGVTITGGVVAVDTTIVARKASATIGDGTSTTITVTHNLNTQDVDVSVKEVSTNAGVNADWVANGVNTVQITFGTAPTTGQYRATVMG